MKRLTALVLFVAAGISAPAFAIDYRTVDVASVLYDTPSQRGA